MFQMEILLFFLDVQKPLDFFSPQQKSLYKSDIFPKQQQNDGLMHQNAKQHDDCW